MDRSCAKNNCETLVLIVEDSSSTRTRSGSTSSTLSSNKNSKSRKTNSLPAETVEYLKAWMMSPEHISHPYPTELEKAEIMLHTGIELKQLTNWFVNNRKRYWKPRVDSTRPSLTSVSAATGTTGSPIKKKRPSLVASDSASIFSLSPPSLLDPPPVTCSMTTSSSSSSLSSPARVSDHSVVSETDSVCSADFSSTDDDLPIVRSNSYKNSLSESSTETKKGVVANGRSLTPDSINVHVLCQTNGNSSLAIKDVATSQPGNQALSTFLCNMESSSRSHNRNSVTPKRCHSRMSDSGSAMFPRPKYRRPSLELWREACFTSKTYYDQELPSLEEAATLFGFMNAA